MWHLDNLIHVDLASVLKEGILVFVVIIAADFAFRVLVGRRSRVADVTLLDPGGDVNVLDLEREFETEFVVSFFSGKINVRRIKK